MTTAIIVGAGHRALIYASLADLIPEEFKIVGVADLDPLRCRKVMEKYGFSEDMCFSSSEELMKRGKLADVIINGTMDSDHVPTTIPMLENGYDVLLEKPFAVSKEEVELLADAVRRTGRKVMICHVLRYAPFYVKIKELINSGTVGEVINIQTAEHVSYHHIANCFIRGKWRRKDLGGSGMLLQKCCHDLDLICWLMSGNAPTRVSSFGSRSFFNREHAPANSGEYCLNDCPLEHTCDYSCRNINLKHIQRWSAYVWREMEHIENPTMEDYEKELLRRDNPYGRCVWKLDNDVVDRQSVIIEFSSGATATHDMIGGTARPCRKIHVIGTKGEIEGVMDDNCITVRHIDIPTGYTEEHIDLNNEGDTTGAFGGHGGGDMRLARDFFDLVNGKAPSISCTMLEDSLNGHRLTFNAEIARETGKVVTC